MYAPEFLILKYCPLNILMHGMQVRVEFYFHSYSDIGPKEPELQPLKKVTKGFTVCATCFKLIFLHVIHKIM